MSGGLRLSLVRIFELVRKEVIQLRRNPALLRLLFVAPVIQLLVFGYAVSTDVVDTPTLVVDQDGSAASRSLVEAFTASGYFRVAARSPRAADAVAALDRGEATLALVIPVGYAADLAAGRGRVQVLIDGTNSNTATLVRGYAARIVRRHAASRLETPPRLAVQVVTRAWYNQELASRNYNVPAVIAMIVLLTSVLMTSLAVVREREVGTLEQLMVSPLSRLELIVGKALPFAVVGLVDLMLISGVAVFWFGVPFAGSFLGLLAQAMVYLLPALGVGLLISTLSKTQQEAFLSTFLFIQPAMLLSGFLFPVASMPRFFQAVAQANPMTHFLVIVRGIFLKGVGFEVLWPRTAILAAMGVVLLAAAAVRFKKRTD
jgi:drug efflux transport system permease protein